MLDERFAGLGVAVDTPARMEIIHPATRMPLLDRDGVPAWIDLLSLDSSKARELQRATIDQQVRSGPGRMTAAQIDHARTERLAKLTVDWHLVTLEGQPIAIPCTEEAARALYAAPELSWLAVAVADFVADLGNYHRARGPS